MTDAPRVSRNYCFTLQVPAQFNSASLAIQYVSEVFNPTIVGSCHPDGIKFCVHQLELAPTTGRFHIQGYVEFCQPETYQTCQRKYPFFVGAHFEKRKGNRNQAIEYCKKEDSRVIGPYEFGRNFGQGSRTDIHEIATKLLEGVSSDTIMHDHPGTYLRIRRNIHGMELDVLRTRKVDWNPCILLFWGSAGSGKTFTARKLAEIYGEGACYEFIHQWNGSSSNQKIWFDGYKGQTELLIQDFGKGCIPWGLFKSLWDNGIQVEVKGDMTKLMPRRIWITSNDPPWEWYSHATSLNDRDALYRRIDYCWEWKGSHYKKNVSVSVQKRPDPPKLVYEPNEPRFTFTNESWIPSAENIPRFAPKDLPQFPVDFKVFTNPRRDDPPDPVVQPAPIEPYTSGAQGTVNDSEPILRESNLNFGSRQALLNSDILEEETGSTDNENEIFFIDHDFQNDSDNEMTEWLTEWNLD